MASTSTWCTHHFRIKVTIERIDSVDNEFNVNYERHVLNLELTSTNLLITNTASLWVQTAVPRNLGTRTHRTFNGKSCNLQEFLNWTKNIRIRYRQLHFFLFRFFFYVLRLVKWIWFNGHIIFWATENVLIVEWANIKWVLGNARNVIYEWLQMVEKIEVWIDWTVCEWRLLCLRKWLYLRLYEEDRKIRMKNDKRK